MPVADSKKAVALMYYFTHKSKLYSCSGS